MHAEGKTEFPLWIEFSGLPRHLAEECKSLHAWPVFKKVVELDTAENRVPGPVDISLEVLGERTGLPAEQVRKVLPKLRKAGVLRCFVPDNDEEDALLQVRTPLPTPTPWEKVRDAHPEWFRLPDYVFRYALATDEAPPPESESQVADPKLREVVDMYLNTVSMKMNAFILDELRLIAGRFDLPMIRKVFARAREREIQTLGWIVTEIRKEAGKGGKKKRENEK